MYSLNSIDALYTFTPNIKTQIMSAVNSTSTRLVVAAIDFGTTFSGYAYAMRHDFLNKPPKITTPNWIGGGNIISSKNPTVLLLDSKQKFVAFGFEAEDKYAELAADGEHKDYYFFRRFKMSLYNATVSLVN